MCTVHALKRGLRDIGANKRAALLLWLTNLILALGVALPFLGWLRGMNHMVAAEATLRGFSLPLLFDLLRYDFSTVVRFVSTLFFWLIVCAVLVSTFMSGGLLAILAHPRPRQEPFFEHFFAGAGRYFGRFFRLLLGAGLCAGIVLLALNAGLGVLVARLSENASELTSVLLLLAQGMVNLLLGMIFLLALHYARIETVVNGSGGMARAFLRAFVFVFRNILSVFALIVVFAALTGAVYLVFAAVHELLPTTSWLAILALMAIQQIAALARSALQVGLYGAELQLFLLRSPKVPEVIPTVAKEQVPGETPPPSQPVLTREDEPEGLPRTDTD